MEETLILVKRNKEFIEFELAAEEVEKFLIF